jgi:predicted TIM-barrel fold metal-dependent hydrolase
MNAPPIVWASCPPLAAESLHRPEPALPAGSCDAHMHVFGEPARYPPAKGARYTSPGAPLDTYMHVAAALGLDRAVLVQPSYYGSDNAYLLDCLARSPGRYRGVVMAPASTPLRELRAWHQLGVRGLRLDLFKASAEGKSVEAVVSDLRASCESAARLGWSVDLYVPGQLCLQITPAFGDLACPVTIAHMGYLVTAPSISESACGEFIDAARAAAVWVKLTGFYRYGEGAGRERARWLAQALLDAMPQRLLWGSDWPHVMSPPQDSGDLLGEFLMLCPHESTQRQILVDNPTHLYGFGPA